MYLNCRALALNVRDTEINVPHFPIGAPEKITHASNLLDPKGRIYFFLRLQDAVSQNKEFILTLLLY